MLTIKNRGKRATALFLSAALALSVNASLTRAAVSPGTPSGASPARAAGASQDGARRGNANYVSNQGALLDDAFVALPLSAVKASGWLENQLLLQKNGLTGHMYLFNDYSDARSMWLGAASGEAWERGPYYMRGLVALAFSLEDPDLIAQAMKWINAVLGSQRADGSFGPVAVGDWWPEMPVLMALRDYYEYTDYKGQPDGRVMPFMEKYFRFEQAQLPAHHLTNWADERGGDNIDSVYWLYDRLYDPANPGNTDWLLDLGNTLKSQTSDWLTRYTNTTVRQHVVNTSQGLKMPTVYYQYDGGAAYKAAAANGILNWSLDHGRIDGLPNSDESARDNRSTRGTETCGIVENMLSMEINERILGEAWMGDYIERLAYNALPAAITPDSTGHTYFVLQNQVLATLGNHEFVNDHGDSSAFGAPNGYDCCFANFHMGWPKFVQTMWMATRADGLAVTAYGPNSVNAKVAGGKTAKFDEQTDYPFKDTVRLTYGGDDASFELKLRVPAWAQDPVITVNGRAMEGVAAGDYYTVNRAWQYGDIVNLTFPSEIRASTWYNNSVGIEKGALIFGLKLDEQWRRLDGTDGNELREEKVNRQPDYPTREVLAAGKWNYGLVIDYNNPAAGFQVQEADAVGLQPFSQAGAPITLKAVGQVIPNWKLDGNLAGPQPVITPYDASKTEPIELIPYGSERLRISEFPRIGNPADTVTRSDGRAIKFNGADYTEFKNVVVPDAGDYTLKITGSGSGSVIVNAKYTQAVSLDAGPAQITGLKSKTSGSFQFNSANYNNLRFTPGLSVSSIEVTPVSPAVSDLIVSAATRAETSVRFVTNLSDQAQPLTVVYGTQSGAYAVETSGFKSDTAIITGLDPDKTYYAKVRTVINGVQKESKEYVFPPATGGELLPDPNAAPANYAGFGSLSAMQGDWTLYDPNGSISFTSDTPPAMRFNRNTDMKAVLTGQGSAVWSDYVAEATLSVDDVARNNCGMMFRVTGPGTGPDGYRGYFAGIGRVAGSVNGPGVIIGYADGSWHELKTIPWTISPGTRYALKVVAYGERFAVYVDGALVTTFGDSRYGGGTIGLRAYDEAFTAYDATVRPVTADDLKVFAVTGGGLTPNPAPDAVYSGFGSVSDYNAAWRGYGNTGSIAVVDNGGAAQVNFGVNTDVKTVLTASPQTSTDPLTWTDFVAEAKLSVDLANNNNCGLMLRSTNIGAGPDNYTGYFAGIGRVSDVGGTGVIIGRADGAWHTVKTVPWDIKAGQVYTLKTVTYGSRLAVFVDGALAAVVDGVMYPAGTIGLRSYNEAFKVYGVSVRNVTADDLAAFDYPVSPSFSDDFSDAAASAGRWTPYGNTAQITFSGGAIAFGSDTNVKAVAGQTAWNNYVYEADVRRTGGGATSDAGLMLRVTSPGSGSDGYHGYYFGVTNTNYVVGWADGGWHQIVNSPSAAVKPQNQYNHLKAVANGSELYFYVNGALVYSMTDTRYAAGQIGLRSYNMSFTADNVTVRAVSQEDLREIAAPPSVAITVSAASSGDIIQIKYPKTQNALTYKIAYGTEPGVYTREIADAQINPYASGSITAGKTAFEAPASGTYYVRFYGLNGSNIVAVSNELAVTTGYEESTAYDRGKLAGALSAAESLDTSAFTRTSADRFALALALAKATAADSAAGEMDLGLARQLLMSAAKGDSIDLSYGAFRAYADIPQGAGDAAAPEYTVVNTGGGADAKILFILAVYDGAGRVTAVYSEPGAAPAGGAVSAQLSGAVPAGGSAKAFIWDGATLAPLCAPAEASYTK